MKLVETLLTAALRAPLVGGAARRMLHAFGESAAGAMKRVNRNVVRPREWSNGELRRFAGLFSGPVINVSGWKDEDKCGGRYRDYFPRASRYAISNFSGARGISNLADEVFLDLEAEVPDELKGKFQVAFNHTVLEHVFDIRRAIANICALSHDTVILVTPFLQQVHFEEGSYGDYWRPTPMCLEKMLQENGFKLVFQSTNDNPWYNVYVVTVAMRRPESHPDFPLSALNAKIGERHFFVS